ncbi:cupin domain-containing protein [Falsiroseomonas tokyonensis]|uniref:Cupin domain-containing protein n=1 Tax=Falsiroseomonas tokyonensis TaxID=430521 RepID=A0ABV7C132_9PROT|nr:cupin domain-containing protein [Falsiroseomonas tokyonensis]MBU8540375.1 cupin domain-containing protein [Falsiroseomonas tokyonensis]
MLSTRLIRYADLIPCRNAFVDSRTPGSDAKENFTLIGPGVSENPNQHVHIPEAHGFNIGGARQPPGCLNSQHSHETAEVFIVHKGRWRMIFGVNADEGDVVIEEGDTISIPTQMYRGFENIGTETGFLFAVLGRDNPGKVTWAPRVFELAQRYGLVLLEGGRLVDTTVGERVPEGAVRQQPPGPEQIAALATPPAERLQGCVVKAGDLRANPHSPLAREGVEELPIIGPASTGDGFEPGPIIGWWPHGFNLRALRLESGASVPSHVREEEEVIFVHRGVLQVTTPQGEIIMGPGDTFTTPKGLPRSFRASSSNGVAAYVVRGGDAPAAPRFL